MLSQNELNKRLIIFENDKCESPFLNYICSILNKSKDFIDIYVKVIHDNILYKKGFYVATRTEDYKIYIILNIIISENNIYLFVQEISNILYIKHYTAFEICPNNLGEFTVLTVDKLIGPPTTLIKTSKGKCMVRPKETI